MIKITEQINETECGICVIKTLINHFHKKQINKSELLERVVLDNTGLSLYDFEVLCHEYGINIDTYNSNWDEFINYKNDNHFVTIINKDNLLHYVIVKKTKKKIIIYDSCDGIKEMEYKDFREIFFDVIIECSKGILHNNSSIFIDKIKKYISIKQILIVNFINLIVVLLSIFGGSFFQQVIDKVINVNDISNLLTISIIFGFNFLLIHLGSWFINLFSSNEFISYYRYLNKNALISISNKHDSFFSKVDYNNLLTLDNHIGNISSFYTSSLNNIFGDSITIISCSILLANYNIWFLLLCIIAILINLLIDFILYHFNKKNIKDSIIINSKYNKNYINFLNNNKITSSSLVNKKMIQNINHDNQDIKKLYNKDKLFISSINFVSNFLRSIFFIVVMFIGVNEILKINSNSSISRLSFSISIIQMILSSTKSLFNIISTIPQYKVSSEIYNNIINIDNIKDNIGINFIETKEIKFTNFNYELKHNKLFKEFNISLQNDTILFGECGIGKTTLLKIISNKIKTDKRNISINDINYDLINSKWINDNVFYISEDIYLSDNSLQSLLNTNYQNLIVELIKMMDLKSFSIEDNISIGERQIFIFISLLLQNNKVLLIDELLSNVSPKIKNFLLLKIKPIISENNFLIFVSHDNSIRHFFKNKEEINA